MSVDLDIALAPERLDEGAAEERAAFGLFTIRTAHGSLTEGFDSFIGGYRPGPLVSGFHVAEWFAWNWWRLCWEPRSASADWSSAHRMASIGEGYVWPDITIYSDGVRTALLSRASARQDIKPFRYTGAPPVVLPSRAFEAAVDAFIPQILARLRDAKLGETNLDRVWRDILAERLDPEVAKRRRLEALLGRDPDSVEDHAIDGLVADARQLGEAAVAEVAAYTAQAAAGTVVTAADLVSLAKGQGYDASPRDAIRLVSGFPLPRGEDVPAWQVGSAAARAVREQEGLGTEPLADSRLAAMAGTEQDVLSGTKRGALNLSFALDKNAGASRIVLRSKWETGRRFELARLIGDRLITAGDALHPATRAYTYRQKAQRTFAAELLSPFEAVDAMMEGDYSWERQQEVAEHFRVSEMTINSLLKNHGRLERDGSDQDVEMAAA
ncbi:hypothetical protein [Labrys wisconsinensis]|uniref:Uncharacterized protein n=1 Tax=Labrys wisconsinensis TaxID=425677 RepID=A0ABU0J657_9HYPH|nr:hypothetical protein [Labrys wisconsinensis]MDQ0469746.1 hypothetical protein [Labrys wisconsinensis]